MKVSKNEKNILANALIAYAEKIGNARREASKAGRDVSGYEKLQNEIRSLDEKVSRSRPEAVGTVELVMHLDQLATLLDGGPYQASVDLAKRVVTLARGGAK